MVEVWIYLKAWYFNSLSTFFKLICSNYAEYLRHIDYSFVLIKLHWINKY